MSRRHPADRQILGRRSTRWQGRPSRPHQCRRLSSCRSFLRGRRVRPGRRLRGPDQGGVREHLRVCPVRSRRHLDLMTDGRNHLGRAGFPVHRRRGHRQNVRRPGRPVARGRARRSPAAASCRRMRAPALLGRVLPLLRFRRSLRSSSPGLRAASRPEPFDSDHLPDSLVPGAGRLVRSPAPPRAEDQAERFHPRSSDRRSQVC